MSVSLEVCKVVLVKVSAKTYLSYTPLIADEITHYYTRTASINNEQFALRYARHLIIIFGDLEVVRILICLSEKLPLLEICALNVTGAHDPTQFVLPRRA